MQQEITFTNGRVDQTNYHQHPMLRMRQAPPIEIFWQKSEFRRRPGWASRRCRRSLPAVANAIFAATGKRIRTLPSEEERIQLRIALNANIVEKWRSSP